MLKHISTPDVFKCPFIAKRIFFLLIVTLMQGTVFGQNESASVLTKKAYYSDPAKYLSKINPNLIPSDILVDRVPFDDLILNVNGKDKVTTLAVNDWVRIYNELKYANSDTSYMGNMAEIEKFVGLYYEQDMTYPIGILDFSFNKVEKAAIDRGDLVENDDFLDARRSKASSFSNQRAVVASCLSHNIYGDNINFIVNGFFYSNNIKDQTLQSVEIDFGNGEGFQQVNLGETINVSYSSASEYIQIKTKLTYENIVTHQVETYYAHSSVFRTGTSTVPVPGIVPVGTNAKNTTPIKPEDPIYYPKASFKTVTECPDPKPGEKVSCCCVTRDIRVDSKLEVHILFSKLNTSGKLRRPFIVTDGFDPGNKRDYFRTDIPLDEDLPLNNDFRGLFQLINGDPSPWYPNEKTPNLIAALRADGYDMVIINFLDGAGIIQNNAEVLRRFFNEILNSSTYRDNKTEEAILVGPSMGGIITRMMLTKMEYDKQEPFVKTWISFDSPQQGANIPLGLQKAIQHLEDKTPGIAKKAKASLRASLDKLNTPAARQLLLSHYTASGKGTAEHDKLYTDLGKFGGYPVYSKNYGISNGGKSKLYDKDGSTIVLFTAIAIPPATLNAVASSSTNSGDQIALDNAPGGWNTALYSLNSDKANIHNSLLSFALKIDFTKTQYNKATFIPTTSAFGIKVTQSNVANIWTSYTKPGATPFDAVHGMETNEEHVKISATTRDYLIEDVLRPDFDNIVKPMARSGKVLNQTVKGKVAYTSKVSTTFGGSGNSFTLESGSDVVSTAGSTIIMSPGFTAKAGSNFVAKIQTINYNTVLRSAIAQLETQSVDYSQVSPYTGTLYSYAGNEVISELLPDLLNYAIYPNPLDNLATIDLSGLEQKYAALQIYNSLGQLVYQNNIENGRNALDLSNLDQGIYLVKITYNGSKVKTSKLIKS